MTRSTIPDSRPKASLLRRIASTGPMVIGVYAASSLALGFGFGNPFVDAVGLASTAGGFAIGSAGIRSVTDRLDGLA